MGGTAVLMTGDVLSVEERFQLCRSVAEECIQDDELRRLLEKKAEPVCYDGFEPSGRMHIAQGILKMINVNKLTKAGCKFIFWVADWFALMNNKMGGDLKKIQTVGKYMIEVPLGAVSSGLTSGAHPLVCVCACVFSGVLSAVGTAAAVGSPPP